MSRHVHKWTHLIREHGSNRELDIEECHVGNCLAVRITQVRYSGEFRNKEMQMRTKKTLVKDFK